jgi:small subunit ribosomal protein S17
MKKTLIGTIVSDKMINTVVVEVTRHIVHPLYKKRIKVTKKYSADTNNLKLVVGDLVKMEEIPPMSKTKYFKVAEKLEDARMPQIKTEASVAVEAAVATEIVEAVAAAAETTEAKAKTKEKPKTRSTSSGQAKKTTKAKKEKEVEK